MRLDHDGVRDRLQEWVVWYRNRRQKRNSLTPRIEAVEKAIATLDREREGYVIQAAMLHNKTTLTIARDIGVEPRTVRQLCLSAYEELAVKIEFFDRQLEQVTSDG